MLSLAQVVNKGIVFRVTGAIVSGDPKTGCLMYRLLSRRDRSDVSTDVSGVVYVNRRAIRWLKEGLENVQERQQ